MMGILRTNAMNQLNIVVIFMFSVVSTNVCAADTNMQCPAEKLLPELDDAYHECSNGYTNGSCKQFVSAFRELTEKSDCRRSFDTSPIPAIWLANSAAFRDYLKLLYRLAVNNNDPLNEAWAEGDRDTARHFFGSGEFRSILDGEYAEEYYEESLQVGHELVNEE